LHIHVTADLVDPNVVAASFRAGIAADILQVDFAATGLGFNPAGDSFALTAPPSVSILTCSISRGR
jgi:hypothetical protein